MTKGVFFCVLVVVAIVQFMAKPGQAAVTCGQVDSSVAPCLPYLTGRSPSPAQECCNGVKTLKGLLVTTADRQTACNCLKQAASASQDIKDDAAGQLPAKCGTQIGVPISRTTDCSKVG